MDPAFSVRLEAFARPYRNVSTRGEIGRHLNRGPNVERRAGLMTVEEQTSFVRTIAAAPRALVILNDANALMPGIPGAAFESLHGTVPEFVRKNCMEITRIDQFRILEVTNRVPAGTNQ